MKRVKNLMTKILRSVAFLLLAMTGVMTYMILVLKKDVDTGTAVFAYGGFFTSLIMLVLCEISEHLYAIREKLEGKDLPRKE